MEAALSGLGCCRRWVDSSGIGPGLDRSRIRDLLRTLDSVLAGKGRCRAEREPRRPAVNGRSQMMILWILLGSLALLATYDLIQKRHAVLRNFPVVGHLRYWLEAFGPELRQYIVTDNDEERPFSRDQRRWVYTLVQAREQLLRLRNRQQSRAGAQLPAHPPCRLSTRYASRGDDEYDPLHRLRVPRCWARREAAEPRSAPSRWSTSRE